MNWLQDSYIEDVKKIKLLDTIPKIKLLTILYSWNIPLYLYLKTRIFHVLSKDNVRDKIKMIYNDMNIPYKEQ